MNALLPDSRPKAAPQGEFEFSDAEFRLIAKSVHASFGLDLQISKKALVYSRLARRVRALGMKNFKEYCDFVEGSKGSDERVELLTALTTNVTHFFREEHHFTLLRNEVFPPLIEQAKAGNRVRIWSAGCSAGQEAYCLAATLLTMFPDAVKHDVKILATDIDPKILETARGAEYPKSELEAIPEAMRSVLVARDKQASKNDAFCISDEARQLVSFGQVNLIADWPMQGKFDVIMCRNVAIYFDKPTQAKLWGRFCASLVDRGYLFIGHSERLSGSSEESFEAVGITAFRKK